jgi:hypothetical protein
MLTGRQLDWLLEDLCGQMGIASRLRRSGACTRVLPTT